MTENEKNEAMALLLGWKAHPSEPGWWIAGTTGLPCPTAPDYTRWERFPEMQEYVRGMLPIEQQADVVAVLMRAFTLQYADVVQVGVTVTATNITPTILRDALIEVLA